MTSHPLASRLFQMLFAAGVMLIIAIAMPASAQGFGGGGGGGSACPACDKKCERRSKNCQNDISRNPLCRSPGGKAICEVKKKDCKRLESFCKKVDCGMMPKECGPPPGKPGRTGGEPHFRTFDGLYYNFQTVGEFILSRSLDGTFETQIRTGAYSSNLAVNTAVGIRIQGALLQMTGEGGVLLIDGVPLDLAEGDIHTVNDHLKIGRPRDYVYSIADDEGYSILITHVASFVDHLNIEIDPSPKLKGQLEGMLGNLNGDYADDIATSDGKPLVGLARNKIGRVTREILYGPFADAWRVTDATSLLPYGPGETTETMTDRTHPKTFVSLSDLTEADYDKAREICLQAGVTGGLLLENCIFDVGFTGDDGFVKGYQGIRNAEAVGIAFINEDASMSAPPTAPQGETVDIHWSGPEGTRDYIGVWTTDAADDAKAISWERLKETSPVTLRRLPVDPGTYELRYMSEAGEVLARQPITVTPGSAQILFKSEERNYPAASDLEVDCRGPRMSENRYRLVSVGENGEQTTIYERDTQTFCSQHIDMPATPGAYELQYIMIGEEDTYVLFREPITVTELVASLSPPETVSAGEEFEMVFNAPTGRWDDYFKFVPQDGGEPTKVKAHRRNNTQKMTAPDKPGRYIVRYMAETSAGIEQLAEAELQVR